jgi:hypothetical protein
VLGAALMTIVTEVEPGSKPFARMRLRKRASLAAIAGPGGAQFTFDNGCSQGENGGAIEAPARAAWLQFPSADVTAFAIPCGLPSLQTTAWPSSRRCCVSRAGSSFARPPWDLPTMNSVSRDPRLPQRHFICTSGHRRGRRRPVRRDRHPSRDGTLCIRHAPGRRHRAQRRQLVHVWPDLRHQRPPASAPGGPLAARQNDARPSPCPAPQWWHLPAGPFPAGWPSPRPGPRSATVRLRRGGSARPRGRHTSR